MTIDPVGLAYYPAMVAADLLDWADAGGNIDALISGLTTVLDLLHEKAAEQ